MIQLAVLDKVLKFLSLVTSAFSAIPSEFQKIDKFRFWP